MCLPHPLARLLDLLLPSDTSRPSGRLGLLFSGFELYRGPLVLEGTLVGGQSGRGSLVTVTIGPRCSSPRPVLLLPLHLTAVPRSSRNRPCVFWFGGRGHMQTQI